MTKPELIHLAEIWLLRLHNEPGLWKVDQALPEISRALDAYALSIVEQSVPPAENVPESIDESNHGDIADQAWSQGYNNARSQTLDNARNLVRGDTNPSQ